MEPMKIVVLDGYALNPGDNPWDEIEALGELAVHDRTAPEQILERSRGAEVLLTNKTPLSRETMEQLPELRYVGVLATGYNVVDVKAAAERGIPVANVPVYGTDSVAQHVFALLLELSNHVGLHVRAVADGEWAAQPDYSFWKTPLLELAGKTMAVVGFGRIGRRVGELAHAFGMRVLAVDIVRRDPPSYEPFAWADLREGFQKADVVSLNCALTPENEGFVDAALLGVMKKSAFLINAARGQLVNQGDLASALNNGRLAGAGVDTVSTEPIRPDNPLLGAKNCLITPHIAWASLEARRRLMHTAAENIEAFLRGEPQNRVN
jgi:glycerate dehydrogenase